MINYLFYTVLFRVMNDIDFWSFSDVVKSMIGTFVWTGILTAWIVVFQLNRVSWGVTADYISFIIPRGQE